MAHVNQDPVEFTKSRRYSVFAERFPDYLSWLDGRQWVLVLGEDIPMDPKGVSSFRSSMHYQARTLQMSVMTTIQTRDGKRVMVIQAQ